MSPTSLRILTIISVLILLVLFALVLIPDEAFSRAGGGGGGSSSSSRGNLISYILFGIFSAIMAAIAYSKNKKCNELLAKLSKSDGAWDSHALKARIETTYFKVQTAWKERNQELARPYISQRLYDKHKLQTDAMIADGHKPIMLSINLKKATIVEVTDFQDNSKDRFCALVEGSMTDYIIDEKTKVHIAGVATDVSFSEFWRFVREGDTWVLDEIDQSVSARELLGMVATSEIASPPEDQTGFTYYSR